MNLGCALLKIYQQTDYRVCPLWPESHWEWWGHSLVGLSLTDLLLMQLKHQSESEMTMWLSLPHWLGLKTNCVYTLVLEDSNVEPYAIDFNWREGASQGSVKALMWWERKAVVQWQWWGYQGWLSLQVWGVSVTSSSIHEKKIPFIFLILNSTLCELQEFNPQHSE